MGDDIRRFVETWLPKYQADRRSYLTIAIGCTGGQHRSVYLVEQLAQAFGTEWSTRVRHREVNGWPQPPASTDKTSA